MLGLYIDNEDKANAASREGLWLAFLGINKMPVFGTDVSGWSKGIASIKKGILADVNYTTQQHVDIVTTRGRDTYIYVTYDGQPQLYGKILFADGKMGIYDSGDTLLREVEVDMNTLHGCGFSIFTHEGTAQVDNLAIYGYGKKFTVDMVGSVVCKSDPYAAVLLEADFEDNDYSLGNKAVIGGNECVEAVDGKLNIGYVDGEFKAKANTIWSPGLYADYDKYDQVQISFDILVPITSAPGEWCGAMLGMYVENDWKANAASREGLWLGFLGINKMSVFGTNVSGWSKGIASIKKGVLGDVNYSTQQHVDIVTTRDRNTYIYVTYDGRPRLYGKILFADGKMGIYDSGDTLLREVEVDMSTLQGCSFSFFSHEGAAQVDDLTIIGCTVQP